MTWLRIRPKSVAKAVFLAGLVASMFVGVWAQLALVPTRVETVTSWLAAAFFGAFLASGDRRPSAGAILLGAFGMLVLAFSTLESVGFARVICSDQIGPNGMKDARAWTWATLLALAGSAVLAAVAARHDRRSWVGWWGATYAWVFLISFASDLFFDQSPSYFYRSHLPLAPPPLQVAVGGVVSWGVAFLALCASLRLPTPRPHVAVLFGAAGLLSLAALVALVTPDPQAGMDGGLGTVGRIGAVALAASACLAVAASRRGGHAALGWWGASMTIVSAAGALSAQWDRAGLTWPIAAACGLAGVFIWTNTRQC